MQLTRSRRVKLSHVGRNGAARMVDVMSKPVTDRQAVACATVRMRPAVLRLIRDRALPKGDVLTVARIAGIQAAKRTAELIPMCHPLALSHIAVDINVKTDRVAIRASVRAAERTGVEMEALTACGVAALTVYDMCKSADRHIVINGIRVVEKRGGRHDFCDASLESSPAGA